MAKTITKLFAIFMVIALCACLFVGCGVEELHKDTWADSGFTLIDVQGQMDYLYHNETKVVYVFIRCDGYRAGMTVLLNPDGTPMIWEGN